MFIGHFAVAFAAKPAAPTVSLGTLFVACELVDLAWPVFLLIGIERVDIRPGITAFTPLDFVHYPWSHSLLMGAAWALALGLLYLRRTRALDRVGSWGLWGLIALLLAAYAGAAFGPPPPSVQAIAWAGLVGGAITAMLGYRVDRHRAMES